MEAYFGDVLGPTATAQKPLDLKTDCIKMAAVGRRFFLGQLYDYRSDRLFTGANFKPFCTHFLILLTFKSIH
jgi:hypothetical protein